MIIKPSNSISRIARLTPNVVNTLQNRHSSKDNRTSRARTSNTGTLSHSETFTTVRSANAH